MSEHGDQDSGEPWVPEVIDCIDCGGRAHLLSYVPPEGWSPGDIVAYRCADCLDRWDLEIPYE